MTDDEETWFSGYKASPEKAMLGGHWESSDGLAWGFLNSGRILAEYWTQNRDDDDLVLPVLYNFRHGIELALKEAIRDAASCVRGDGLTDAGWTTAELDKTLSTSHAIGRLVQQLNEGLDLLNRFGARTIDIGEDMEEVLAGLHALDETGQALRYTTVKQGTHKAPVLVAARPTAQEIDLEQLALALWDAGNRILQDVCPKLTAYREWGEEQNDLRRQP